MGVSAGAAIPLMLLLVARGSLADASGLPRSLWSLWLPGDTSSWSESVALSAQATRRLMSCQMRLAANSSCLAFVFAFAFEFEFASRDSFAELLLAPVLSFAELPLLRLVLLLLLSLSLLPPKPGLALELVFVVVVAAVAAAVADRSLGCSRAAGLGDIAELAAAAKPATGLIGAYARLQTTTTTTITMRRSGRPLRVELGGQDRRPVGTRGPGCGRSKGLPAHKHSAPLAATQLVASVTFDSAVDSAQTSKTTRMMMIIT